MSLRVTCAADAEIRTLAANGIDEVARVRERLRRRVTLRNIAAQRQNILNAARLKRIDGRSEVLFVLPHTRQMCQRRNAAFLHLFCNGQCVFGVGAACAVGHAHKRRLICRDLMHHLLCIFQWFARLRREHLARDRHLIGLQNIGNSHFLSLSLSILYFHRYTVKV